MISMVELGKLILHLNFEPPRHIVVFLMVGQPPLASTLSFNQTHQHWQVHHQASTQTTITKKPNKARCFSHQSTTKPIKICTITTTKPSEELTPTINSTKSWLKKKWNVANTTANHANLLPTSTTLVFQALMPSLSGDGKCLQKIPHDCILWCHLFPLFFHW
jgi:hypothetical protein